MVKNLKCLENSHFHSVQSKCGPPSIARVERAVCKLKRDKAVGPDLIPAELLKTAGAPLIHIFHCLFAAIYDQVYVPLMWRGGRLVELHKKAPQQLRIISGDF